MTIRERLEERKIKMNNNKMYNFLTEIEELFKENNVTVKVYKYPKLGTFLGFDLCINNYVCLFTNDRITINEISNISSRCELSNYKMDFLFKTVLSSLRVILKKYNGYIKAVCSKSCSSNPDTFSNFEIGYTMDDSINVSFDFKISKGLGSVFSSNDVLSSDFIFSFKNYWLKESRV